MNTAFGPGLRTRTSVNIKGRLAGRLKAIALISLPEAEAAKIVHGIESDPLFQKLFFPDRQFPRVIKRQAWPASRLDAGFYKLREEAAAGPVPADIEPALSKYHDLIAVVRKMGREAFERYFLYGTEALSFEEIAEKTGLEAGEVKKIHELILEATVHVDIAGPARLEPRHGVMAYTAVAHLERDPLQSHGIALSWTMPHLARGRYAVNHEALAEWQRRSALTKAEKKNLRRLLQKIELINMRHTTLFRVLEAVIERQTGFLVSQSKSRRRPLSMRSLASYLGLAPSTISRIAANRSVVLPWNEEVPLARLMAGRHEVLKSVLGEILESRGALAAPLRKLSDQALVQSIRRDYNLIVSRRTVNEVRRALMK
ncbi:MAG: hypothetical protein HY747_08685 [Elusimicrobia bacterium]|nr:hypothetical protein [Elusimicrobiota bacterium]